ncbi:CDP-diacylglycerol--glycerol-3-phosphate 3-phosphatidyltransferase [Blyttiomyces sp. JEL0837]|nr:CDP-diacylglycerol--glycerol-3-phosphate 3-phosphatidyltransferase [Blyttiomyces sp. JEL0837]
MGVDETAILSDVVTNAKLPAFAVPPERMKVIDRPVDFYQSILKGIRNSKQRIVLASLYIGPEETELVETIRARLKESPNGPVVHILIDYLRGTRHEKGTSSAGLLAELAQEFPDRVKVSLFQFPSRNIFRRVIPQRFNEAFGLMHMKFYAFDDDLIMSGANLNKDYFQNRQDRYVLFEKSARLVDYFEDLANTVAKHSHSLNSSGTVTMGICRKPELRESILKFSESWRSRLLNSQSSNNEKGQSLPSNCNTVVLPLLQIGPIKIYEEERFITTLMKSVAASNKFSVTISSAYLNFPRSYLPGFVRSSSRFSFISAAPEANGFFNSRGVSRHLPAAYTHLQDTLWRRITASGRDKSIELREYKREGWTFHAKGLWCSIGQSPPAMTIIGSSNFGRRSLVRDMEAQLIVLTKDRDLQERLDENLKSLKSYTEVVDGKTFSAPHRRPHPLVIATVKLIRTML